MIRTAGTIRWWTLLLSTPFALLMSQRLQGADGSLFVVTHVCLTLLWATLSARSELDAGLTPRLGLAGRRVAVDRERLDLVCAVLLLLTPAMATLLLFANVWLGLGAALATVLAIRRATEHVRTKFGLIELIVPVVGVAAPATLLAAHSWPPIGVLGIFSSAPDAPAEASGLLTAVPVETATELVSAGALAACWLGAAIIATLMLLCLIRDVEADKSAGAVTTATRIGRAGAVALARAWTLGIVALACFGAASGWWGWLTALVGAWTVVAIENALATRRDERAVGAAFSGFALMAILLAATSV